MLTVKKISKSFGNVKAVDSVSFSIKKGDIVGLLGPNGAGKTTTMRMIASYYFPSSGTILVDNLDTQVDTIKAQQQIGYLPENNPLYLDMMVIDYLMMTGNLFNVDKKKLPNIIRETAKAVGIADKLTTTMNELSKGYKQRVGIAAAILHDPKIIILDEPTEGLDPNQREEIRKLIKKLSKDKAILISTHVMQEVKAMCNKVVVIDKGKLVAEGLPDSLTKNKRIEIHLEGKSIKEILKKLASEENESVSVTKEHTADEKADVYKVVITTHRELRPEISKLAEKHNWTIWEMHMQDNLEEVFEGLK